MSISTVAPDSLQVLGLDMAPAIHRNDLAPALYEETVRRGTGRIGVGGALIVDTTPYTGRSPKDKFIVRDATTEDHVAWGAVNAPFETALELLGSLGHNRVQRRQMHHTVLVDGHVLDAVDVARELCE